MEMRPVWGHWTVGASDPSMTKTVPESGKLLTWEPWARVHGMRVAVNIMVILVTFP